MNKRIRRNAAPVVDTNRIDALMKSISTATSLKEQHEATIKKDTAELYILMKAANIQSHQVEDITAELFRPAGRSSTHIDPQGFRKLVKDDAEFYGAITVSVTNAKKVLAQKQLDTITTKTPATPGEEQVRIHRG